MDDDLRARLTAGETWLRGFHILLFAILYSVAELVIAAVVVFQFLATLVTGRNNGRLVKFGQGLSTYVYQVMLFFTYNSDAKPYPFGPWPAGAPGEGPGHEGKGAAPEGGRASAERGDQEQNE